MTTDNQALLEEAHTLAKQHFSNGYDKAVSFIERVIDTYTKARGKDFLLIHNPGGWGSNSWEHCMQWEKNIITGIDETIERLGYTRLSIQYFRSGNGWRDKLEDLREQFSFFAGKARTMAAELELITRYINDLTVIIVGISQGAAFTNAVMQQLKEHPRVYSVELGCFFPYMPKRVITERTLAIDDNGLVPDAAVRRELRALARAYMSVPFKWFGYLLRGRPRSFSQCANIRGHNYDWGYPEVRRRVIDFLETNFSTSNRPID